MSSGGFAARAQAAGDGNTAGSSTNQSGGNSSGKGGASGVTAGSANTNQQIK